MKKLSEINQVLIVGAGTLGLRIGLQSAISGYETRIYDVNASTFEKAKQIQNKILASLVKAGNLDEALIDDIHARIQWTSDASEACENVDLVSESVTENLELKKKVWASLVAKLDEGCILTTNTSYLLPSQILEAIDNKSMFCAFHFHDVFNANVVDIMPHPETDAAIIPLLEAFGRKLNQIPVVVKKENPGYLFNSILLALIGAAGKLATLDIASIQDIDRSWMGNFKMPIGPFGMLDEIGLDTAWHITSTKKDPASQRFAAFLKTYIDQGKLGTKTGEGFYHYPHPEFKNDDFAQ